MSAFYVASRHESAGFGDDAPNHMKRWLKEPLLHFLLLGAALFALHAWRAKQRPADAAVLRIEVTAAVVERLCAGYERQFGRSP